MAQTVQSGGDKARWNEVTRQEVPAARGRKVPYPFAILLFAYAIARYKLAFTLSSPVFGWRPSDMASIALEYARNGFHFFYPQVFWGGNGPGYVEMEFPIVPFLTAVLFKLFGPHEYLNLVIPTLCGVGIVWTIYLIGTMVADPITGLAAGLVAAVVPTLTMLTTTGLWADPPQVLFSTLGIYWMARWAKSDETRQLALAVACFALSILLKLTALYVGIPILYLFIKKLGSGFWKSPIVWLAGAGILLPPVLWYWHAYRLGVEYHNSFGILSRGYSKFGNRALLTAFDFYRGTVRKIFLYHFTPLGTFALIYGVVETIRRRSSPLLLCWGASVVFYIFVAARGVQAGHYHYLLPILPIGALFAGVGFVAAIAWLEEAARHRGVQLVRPALLAASLVLFGSNAAWAAQRFENRDRVNDGTVWAKKKVSGLRVKQVTAPGSLIIVVDTQMDDATPDTAMAPPDVFYFADRKGWYISLAWLTPDWVERLRAQGAKYLVVSGQSIDDFQEKKHDLYEYFARRYPEIGGSGEALVFDLTRSIPGEDRP